MLQQRQLTKIFNELQKTSPTLVAGATPIGIGEAGLVIDHHDGTVTKLLFRKDSTYQGWAETCLGNELTFLRLTRGTTLDCVQIPEIVADVTHFEEGVFFASYRMTKLPGTPANWQAGLKQAPDHHFIEAGAVTALFHQATAPLPFSGGTLRPPFINMDMNTPKKGKGKENEQIDPVPLLDQARNDALAKANIYLQTHRQAGILHGDLHGKNILLDNNGRISGLVDFAFTGPYQNMIYDFTSVPPEKEASFIKGYAEASGKSIDPMMMAVTRICILEKHINQLAALYADFPDTRKKWFEKMDALLLKARPITNYTPH